jgi:hypothetical protein
VLDWLGLLLELELAPELKPWTLPELLVDIIRLICCPSLRSPKSVTRIVAMCSDSSTFTTVPVRWSAEAELCELLEAVAAPDACTLNVSC